MKNPFATLPKETYVELPQPFSSIVNIFGLILNLIFYSATNAWNDIIPTIYFHWVLLVTLVVGQNDHLSLPFFFFFNRTIRSVTKGVKKGEWRINYCSLVLTDLPWLDLTLLSPYPEATQQLPR